MYFSENFCGIFEIKNEDSQPQLQKGKSHEAEVQSKVATRSYEVVTEDGWRFGRNIVYLRKTPENFDLDGPQSPQEHRT